MVNYLHTIFRNNCMAGSETQGISICKVVQRKCFTWKSLYNNTRGLIPRSITDYFTLEIFFYSFCSFYCYYYHLTKHTDPFRSQISGNAAQYVIPMRLEFVEHVDVSSFTACSVASFNHVARVSEAKFSKPLLICILHLKIPPRKHKSRIENWW